MTRLEAAVAEVAKYKQESDDLLLRPQTTELLAECSKLKLKLEAITNELRLFKRVYGAGDPDIKTAEETIQMLLCRIEPITSTGSNLRDNIKMLYQESGNWARHFSIVRMTVMTFTITTSALVIAWFWQSRVGGGTTFSPSVVPNSAALVGLLGLFVFGTFTQLTYKELSKQRYFRSLLVPSRPRDGEKQKPLPFDWASAAISALVIFSAFLVWHYETGVWFPLNVALSVLAAFSLVFCKWHRSWVKRK